MQGPWNHSGSANRGFVSLDPERQREVVATGGRPARPRLTPSEFSFEVRCAARSRQAAPATGESSGKGRKRGQAADSAERESRSEGGRRR